MNKKFSSKWKASSQKRKQRKYIFNLPLHLRRKLLSSKLSKDLRKRYSKRSFPLRKGDTVKILRGKFKGKEGKITALNRRNNFAYVENIQIAKKDGSKVNFPLRASKLMLVELNLDDKKRLEALESKMKALSKEKK